MPDDMAALVGSAVLRSRHSIWLDYLYWDIELEP
jgi:hypothetical protein